MSNQLSYQKDHENEVIVVTLMDGMYRVVTKSKCGGYVINSSYTYVYKKTSVAEMIAELESTGYTRTEV